MSRSAQVIHLVPRSKRVVNSTDAVTSLHLDISREGKIARHPLSIHPSQALTLLRLLLPIASHALTIHSNGDAA